MEDEMSLHVFFDNSNIWLSARYARAEKEPDLPNAALRIYYKNLFQLFEAGRPVISRSLSGSVPPSCEALWEYARQIGCDVSRLKRVQSDDGGMEEQAVDEILHMKIANAILDHRPPQTLVLATGDGKTSAYQTSFPGQVRRALKAGWEVELWAWKGSMNSEYKKISEESGNMLSIKYLDDHYFQVTFAKGGTYPSRDKSGAQVTKTVKDRIVQSISARGAR
jgi:hypothetical protein